MDLKQKITTMENFVNMLASDLRVVTRPIIELEKSRQSVPTAIRFKQAEVRQKLNDYRDALIVLRCQRDEVEQNTAEVMSLTDLLHSGITITEMLYGNNNDHEAALA